MRKESYDLPFLWTESTVHGPLCTDLESTRGNPCGRPLLSPDWEWLYRKRWSKLRSHAWTTKGKDGIVIFPHLEFWIGTTKLSPHNNIPSRLSRSKVTSVGTTRQSDSVYGVSIENWSPRLWWRTVHYAQTRFLSWVWIRVHPLWLDPWSLLLVLSIRMIQGIPNRVMLRLFGVTSELWPIIV